MEYKSFFEEDKNIFHVQSNIYFSQCNANKDLSLHELLKITSDIAVEDYRQCGMSRKILKDIQKLEEKVENIIKEQIDNEIFTIPENYAEN